MEWLLLRARCCEGKGQSLCEVLSSLLTPLPRDVQESAGRCIDHPRQLGHEVCLLIGGSPLPTLSSSLLNRQQEFFLPSASDSNRGRESRGDQEISLILPDKEIWHLLVIRDLIIPNP